MPEEPRPEPPKWVFWSTRESIDDDVPSVMAIVETILAVPAYWAIAIYFQTYWPLLLSMAIAPLVLLRSDESVALGVRWFMAWKEKVWDDHRSYGQLSGRERAQVWLVGAVAAAGGFAFAYFASRHYLIGLEGWDAFWRGALISLAAGAVTLLAFPFVLAIAIGVFVVSVTVRVAATLRYIQPGLGMLPRNFRRLALCTSPLQLPELVPGLAADAELFTLQGIANPSYSSCLGAANT